MPAPGLILRASLFALLACASQGCAKPVTPPQMTLPDLGPSETLVRNDAGRSQPPPVVSDLPVPPETVERDSAPEVFATADQAGRLDPAAQAAQAIEASLDVTGYSTVGGVLAEVNGKPIFSDDVIDAVRNELRGLATQEPAKERYLQQAQAVIERELKQRINDEMLRLVAERNLTRADRERALFAATQYRVNRITAAGGSEARARQDARDEFGISLEKLVEETEQRFLFQLFVQAVILPRAIPSAEEMRDYFLRHQDSYSGQGKGEIEFLLIEFNPQGPATSPQEMRVRAEHVQSLAAAGEDFAALAAEYNDNPSYKEKAGAVPGMPLGRGDFRWSAVDAAVWATPAQGVTGVIAEDGGNRLFIAKVLRKTEPQAVGFDEAQDPIRDQIANQRRIELIQQYIAEAEGYAAITPVEQVNRNLKTAMEVVSQHYESWRAAQ